MYKLLAFTLGVALVASVCGQGRVCPTANICYAIDESGSINSSEFQEQTDALVAITNQFSQLAGGSSFSAVGFSTTAEVVSAPTTDVTAFNNALTNNPQVRSRTSSGSGLELCREQLNSVSDPRIILLFTDGQDNVNPRGTAVAPGIKADGITIATVGVGNNVNVNDLQAIATRPDLYTSVSDFSMLASSVSNIVDALCTAVSPSPSPSATPSSTPSATPSVTPSVTPRRLHPRLPVRLRCLDVRLCSAENVATNWSAM